MTDGRTSTLMADPVALVSIISGAAVAITVPFINAVLERGRLRRQTATSRVEELRSVLDAGLQALSEARGGLTDAAAVLDRLASSDRASTSEIRDFLTRRSAAGEALVSMRRERNRLAVRLGTTHQIVRAYDTGLTELTDAHAVLASWVFPDPDAPDQPYVSRLERPRNREEALGALGRAEKSEARFSDASSKLVGVVEQ